jgi:hypothetical protein
VGVEPGTAGTFGEQLGAAMAASVQAHEGFIKALESYVFQLSPANLD